MLVTMVIQRRRRWLNRTGYNVRRSLSTFSVAFFFDISHLDSSTRHTEMPGVPTTNARLVLAERPGSGAVTSSTFRYEQVSLGPLRDGQVLVRVEYSAIVCPVLSNVRSSAHIP